MTFGLSIKKCDRESARRRTDRQTDALTDVNLQVSQIIPSADCCNLPFLTDAYNMYTVSEKTVETKKNCYNSTKTCQVCLKFYTRELLNVSIKIYVYFLKNARQLRFY